MNTEKLDNLVVVISSRYDNRINVIGPFNFLSEAQNFVIFSANADKLELGEPQVEFMDDDYYMETRWSAKPSGIVVMRHIAVTWFLLGGILTGIIRLILSSICYQCLTNITI